MCAMVATDLMIMKECIPRRALPRIRRLLWINNVIIRLIRKPNAAFRKAKKTGKPSHLAKYRNLRNTVVKVLRSSKRDYFTCLNKCDNKQFWKAFKAASKNGFS